jgi:hypothetical protein
MRLFDSPKKCHVFNNIRGKTVRLNTIHEGAVWIESMEGEIFNGLLRFGYLL